MEPRTWNPEARERKLVCDYRDLSIEVEVMEEELKKLKEKKDALAAKVIDMLKARGMSSARFPEVGLVRYEVRTYYSIEDPEAFDAWWRGRGLAPETFLAIHPSKVGSFCKAQEEADGELPKGVKTYDKERLVVNRG